MKLGKVLGSISPAFGMISGQGLGQYLPFLSPAFLMAKGLGHHGGEEQETAGPGPLAGPMPSGGLDINAFAQSMNPMGDGGMARPGAMFPLGHGAENRQLLRQMMGGGNFLGRLGGRF